MSTVVLELGVVVLVDVTAPSVLEGAVVGVTVSVVVVFGTLVDDVDTAVVVVVTDAAVVDVELAEAELFDVVTAVSFSALDPEAGDDGTSTRSAASSTTDSRTGSPTTGVVVGSPAAAISASGSIDCAAVSADCSARHPASITKAENVMLRHLI